MKKHLFGICYALLLAAFSLYVVLDTFVLSASYESAASPDTAVFSALRAAAEAGAETEAGAEDGGGGSASALGSVSSASAAAEPYSDETSYRDEGVSVTISTYCEYSTAIYVADVELSSAEYLRTAFAYDTYGKNVTANTSEIALDNDAILAINGDYYGVQEKGYVIRNGTVYRDSAKGADVLCIYADGTMEIVCDRDVSAAELAASGVWQAFSFGPALIEDGVIAVDENTEVGRAKASNPRTAIGIIDANHFVFVVSDGRTAESAGLSLYELASFMRSLGVTTAYNLDGGGSSTMVFNGRVVNKPTSGGSIRERGVSDIVFIAPASNKTSDM